jgi:hypothetical protein
MEINRHIFLIFKGKFDQIFEKQLGEVFWHILKRVLTSYFVSLKFFGQVSESCHHLMLKISLGHSLTMLQQKIEEMKKALDYTIP